MNKISNLNINLLVEQVYINGQVNRIYEGMLNEEERVDPKDESIVKTVMKDMGLGTSFIFQFGTGIGAFMRPVTELLANQSVSMTHEEVALLLVTAFSIMLTHSNVEIGKLRKAVKDRGLDIHLGSVTNMILKIKGLMVTIGEKIGRTIHTLSDVLGFTFMLVPAMNIIKDVINMNGITSDTLGQLFGGLTLAAGSYGIKAIIDKITNKLTKKGDTNVPPIS